MPGSSKKGRHSSGAQSKSEGEGINPTLRDFLNAMKEDIVQSNKETFGRIEARLDKNVRSVAGLEKKLEETEGKIGTKIATEVSKEVTKQCAPALAAISAAPRKLSQDLGDAVRIFFRTHFGLGNDRIAMPDNIDVFNFPNKLAKDRKEVLATFENREDRDFIKAQGTNLVGQKEAGMSIQLPGHLLDNLAALNGPAYSVKQKIPRLRRSVKFDDAVQDLYLDVCIAGNWRRVAPTQAKADLKNVPSSGGDSGLLDTSVISDLNLGKEVSGLTAWRGNGSLKELSWRLNPEPLGFYGQ